MKEVRILDCTLRDGGHVNNANFGEENIKSIVTLLNESNTDIIELGFLRNGTFTKDQSNYNTIEEAREKIDINKKQKYSVMIRPDWYDIEKLTESDGVIDTIRFAFYYKDIELTKRCCDIAKKLGYKCILNPVNVMGYDDCTLRELLKQINEMKPYGVTMVDTFGSMTADDLDRVYSTFEEYIDENIVIGLHLHENLSLAFSIAQHFLKTKKANRNVIIDGSLLGMGRVPGNLCVEVIMDYMNSKYNENYNIQRALLAISKYIEPIKNSITWGYSPAYYLSGKWRIHRSYAEYLLKKKDINLEDIMNILERFKDDKQKSGFSEIKAEKLYELYKETEK